MDNVILQPPIFPAITTFIQISLLIVVVFILFYFINLTINKYFENRSKELVMMAKVNYQDLAGSLDAIISDGINDFIISKGLFGEYISEDKENEMRDYIITYVSERISDTFYEKLQLIYNQDSIPDIIAKRIYNAVTGYVMNTNAVAKK